MDRIWPPDRASQHTSRAAIRGDHRLSLALSWGAWLGVQMQMVEQMEWNTRRVLGNDTSAISTLRCLKLYLERLGCNFLDPDSVHVMAGAPDLLSAPSCSCGCA